MYLGAYNLYPSVEAFYQRCDAMLVVGSRLRSNETLTYKLKLPKNLYRIDADARGGNRNYRSRQFVAADARLALAGLADRLEGRLRIDADFAADLARTRDAAVKLVRDGLGPYAGLVDALQAAAGRDFVWVRDVTVSNSTWGNRSLRINGPRDGVHALGGGIGQGLPMGIGAALAGGRAQDLRAVRRRRSAALAGGTLHVRPGGPGRRAGGDERRRLRRHQEHPGRDLRRAPALRRDPHARLRGPRTFHRACASPRVAHRGCSRCRWPSTAPRWSRST